MIEPYFPIRKRDFIGLLRAAVHVKSPVLFPEVIPWIDLIITQDFKDLEQLNGVSNDDLQEVIFGLLEQMLEVPQETNQEGSYISEYKGLYLFAFQTKHRQQVMAEMGYGENMVPIPPPPPPPPAPAGWMPHE